MSNRGRAMMRIAALHHRLDYKAMMQEIDEDTFQAWSDWVMDIEPTGGWVDDYHFSLLAALISGSAGVSRKPSDFMLAEHEKKQQTIATLAMSMGLNIGQDNSNTRAGMGQTNQHAGHVGKKGSERSHPQSTPRRGKKRPA